MLMDFAMETKYSGNKSIVKANGNLRLVSRAYLSWLSQQIENSIESNKSLQGL